MIARTQPNRHSRTLHSSANPTFPFNAPREQRSSLPGRLLDESPALEKELRHYIAQFPDVRDTEIDAIQFTQWLERRQPGSVEIEELLVCLNSTRAGETATLHKRLKHARFLALQAGSRELLEHQNEKLNLTVLFNPVAVWAAVHRKDGDAPRGKIMQYALFFQTDSEVCSLVTPEELLPFLQRLEQADLTLRTLLTGLSQSESSYLWNVLIQLVDLKLLAVSR